MILIWSMSSLSFALLEEIKCGVESVFWGYFFITLKICRIKDQLISEPDFSVADVDSQETMEASKTILK
jgi:hypothetical protein